MIQTLRCTRNRTKKAFELRGCVTEQRRDFQKSFRLNFYEAIYVIGNYEKGEGVV